MNKQKTGALIAAIRKEKGLTQEQLGEKLYVTGKAVSKWERDVTFAEQMGSGFRFTNGTDSLTVSSKIYWRYFVVWQGPTHTLQGP